MAMSSQHVKVQPSEGKGSGLFANIDVGPGARLFSEPPLLRLSCQADRIVPRQGLEITFRMLAHDDRHYIGHLPVETPLLAKISTWKANKSAGWHLSSEWERQVGAQILGSGHFYREDGGHYIHLARQLCGINHSCEPNCRASYDGESGQWALRAIREIRQHEELTINYFKGDVLQMLLPTDQRRARIRALRGWECRCVRCMVAQPELEHVREKALDMYLNGLQGLPVEMDNLERVETVIQDIAHMMVFAKQLGLPELKHKVLDWSLQWALEKRLEVATIYRRRLVRVMGQAYGEDHPAVRKVRVLDLSHCTRKRAWSEG